MWISEDIIRQFREGNTRYDGIRSMKEVERERVYKTAKTLLAPVVGRAVNISLKIPVPSGCGSEITIQLLWKQTSMATQEITNA